MYLFSGETEPGETEPDEPDNELDCRMMELSLYRKDLSIIECLNDRFMLVDDNVDLMLKRRHYTTSKSNQDLHMCHAIAVSLSKFVNF